MDQRHSGPSKVAPIEHRVAAIEAVFEQRGMEPQAVHRNDDACRRRGMGSTETARASSPRRGPTPRSVSACWQTAKAPSPSWASRCRRIIAISSCWRIRRTVHNVICCTLCSCTAFTIIGLPPDWYKDLEYRARVVRESRTVLREMGLDLPPEIEIRVWDTTADTRYMVLPVQPPETVGWPEERLVDIVTKESMIGVARL